MFHRQMSDELLKLSKQYPVVTVMGPRQSGKTTLVKSIFPDKPYVNLESLNTRELAQSDPVSFLDQYPDGVILDEIQRCPHLLSEIQVRVDAVDKKGMYILTGSHQTEMKGAITQSLAGRTAILHLLPFSMQELGEDIKSLELEEILYKGCFPRLYKDGLNPTQLYNGYVQTYIERDLSQMVEIKNLSLFQKFLKLCAGRIGQVFNKDQLAGEVGVSAKTIGHWVSILEASYLVFLLPPYFENFGKRVVKSPKLYFCDVGLAAYLLGIENVSQMQRDPLRGHLTENLVVLELIKARWNQGLEHRLYFYRDANRNEVDVVYQRGRDLVPIEIKAGKTFNRSFIAGLINFEKLVGDRCQDPHLIYAGKEQQKVGSVQLRHFAQSAEVVQKSN